MSLQKRFGLAASTGILAIAIGAFNIANAGVIPPELEFSLQVGDGNPIHFFPAAQQTGETTWLWEGSYAGNGWAMPSCNISANIDPWVNLNVTLQNNTLATQIYTITVTLPVLPVGPGSLMDGSMGGSITDSNGNGVALVNALPGGSIYQATIDGNTVMTLLNDPFSSSPANAGGTSIYTDSFGQPNPIGGPSVVNTIGIILQFQLSAGDSIAMTSFFRVEDVPAPGALALLGLAGLVGRSRRR